MQPKRPVVLTADLLGRRTQTDETVKISNVIVLVLFPTNRKASAMHMTDAIARVPY
jgi:hypothetical protein